MTLLLLLGAIAASLFVLVALRAALAGPLHAPRYWLIPPRTGGPVLAASKQIVFVLLGAVAAYLSAAVLFTCELRLGVVDSAAPHDTVIDVIPGRPAEAAGLRDGRSYVGDGRSHLMDFAVEGTAVGRPGP